METDQLNKIKVNRLINNENKPTDFSESIDWLVMWPRPHADVDFLFQAAGSHPSSRAESCEDLLSDSASVASDVSDSSLNCSTLGRRTMAPPTKVTAVLWLVDGRQ